MQRFKKTGGIVYFALYLLIAVFVTPAFQPVVFAKEKSFRILISNDDGIDSQGIETLAGVLSKIAEVVVVAPNGNRSGASHSIDLRKDFTVKPHYKNGSLFGYGASGSPADCVRFGILEMGKDREFDLVVSGINKGSNVGKLSHWSGTVGAAMEGLYNGIPAVAVSQSRSEVKNYNLAACYTMKIVKQIMKKGLPRGVMLNINIPNPRKVKGVKMAPMGGDYIKIAGFHEDDEKNGVKTYGIDLKFLKNPDKIYLKGSDTEAFMKDYITVTPLQFDWTDQKMMKELQKWDTSLK